MGFHAELNNLAKTITLPASADAFKIFLADVHILYDNSWDKKSKKIPNIIVTKNTSNVSIIQSTIRTNIPIKTYKSIHDASKYTNINENSILKTCNGKQKTAGGYKWSFYEDIE